MHIWVYAHGVDVDVYLFMYVTICRLYKCVHNVGISEVHMHMLVQTGTQRAVHVCLYMWVYVVHICTCSYTYGYTISTCMSMYVSV